MDLNPKDLIKNFDLDGSGTVSEKEIELSKELIEISLREDKSASQKGMAWVAVGSMCIFAVLPLMPFVPESRLDTLASLSDMLFLSQASIVGLYFGATAMMHKK
jgi:hypothetical protein